MQTTRVRHRFSVDDYDEMVARAIITENDRVELIRGEVLEKRTIGDMHAACVKRLNRLFGSIVGDRAIISIQDPIHLTDSEPEPDVALLRPRPDFYASARAQPIDVFLLIEVADASLNFDCEVRDPLYAENGICEYWIVNLLDGCIEVHRHPRADGRYADVQTHARGESITIEALPGCALAVNDISPEAIAKPPSACEDGQPE